MQIHKYLDLDPETKLISCTECGEELCRGDQNFKEYSVMRTGPVTDAGPSFEAPTAILEEDPHLEFRQFFCPSCAVLLDYRFAREGDPLLHDVEIDINALE